MQLSSFHSLPPFFFFLGLVWAILLAIFQIGVLGYAYEKMGISRRAAYWLLFLSLLGSGVNIRVAELHGPETMEMKVVHDAWGVAYLVGVPGQWPNTMLAINVGGALIPTLLSIYLIAKNQIYVNALIGVAAVAFVVNLMAHPVPGMGISVPIFIPPIVSALVAIFLSRDYAA